MPYPIKNARYTLLVPMLDADGDPTDPTTPDTEVSQDGGAYADAAEEATTVTGSNGTVYITLTGAETNNSAVGVTFKVASGPKATIATLYPRNLPILESGTAGAGASGSITLASGTYTGLNLAGCFVRTTGGTGGGGTGGASNQARRITSYNTGTRVATVTPNWETTPDNTTTYDVLLPEGVLVPMLTALAPTTLARTLDVSSGGEAGVDWANVGSPTTAVNLSGTSTKALEPTTAGRTLDVTATGAAGVDWGNVENQSTAVNLSATNIDADQVVASVTGAVGSVTGNVGGNVTGSVGSVAAGGITAASIATGAIDADALAADAVDEIWDEQIITGMTARAALTIASSGGLGQFSVDDAAATATSFVTDLTSAVDDFYNDMQLQFTSGALAGQTRVISDYVGATKTVTLDEALTSAPANGVTFVVSGPHTHTVTSIADAILDRDASSHTTNSTLGAIINDWENGGRLDTIVDSILDDTGTSGVLISSGTGTGQLVLNNGVVDARLADAVSHGGTLGSSTATLALSRLSVVSQTTDTPAIRLAGNGAGAGLSVVGGDDGNGFDLSAGGGHRIGLSVSGTGNGNAVSIASGGSGAALSVLATGLAAAVQFGDGTSGEEGLKILAGTAATDAHAMVLTGAGTGIGLNTNGITGNLSGTVGGMTAAGWATAFTTDTTKTYADAVAGSVVKEIADNAGGASLTVQDIVDGILDEATSGHTTAGTVGKAIADTKTDTTAILADTNELQTDWVDGGRLDLILDARASQTSVDAIDDYVDTEVAAIKAKTDNLPASPAATGDIPSAATIATAVLTTAMTEAYRSTGGTATLAQFAYEVIAHMGNSSIAGTTKTLTKLDKTTTAKEYTLDSATTPTAIEEAS